MSELTKAVDLCEQAGQLLMEAQIELGKAQHESVKEVAKVRQKLNCVLPKLRKHAGRPKPQRK